MSRARLLRFRAFLLFPSNFHVNVRSKSRISQRPREDLSNCKDLAGYTEERRPTLRARSWIREHTPSRRICNVGFSGGELLEKWSQMRPHCFKLSQDCLPPIAKHVTLERVFVPRARK